MAAPRSTRKRRTGGKGGGRPGGASPSGRSEPAKLRARVAELQGALRRARGVGEAMRRVGMAVGAGDDSAVLLQLVIDTTTEVLRADRATLYLLEGDRLVSRVKQGDELANITLDVGHGIAGHVARTGKVARVKDAYADRRFDRNWDERTGYRTRSVLAVPLRNHLGQIVGVLQALNKLGPDDEPCPFAPYDTELLRALANHAAISLDKTALIQRLVSNFAQLEQTKERLERSLRDLELLYDLETSMGRAEDVAEIARSAIMLTGGACNAAAGALLHFAGSVHTLYVVNLEQPDEVRQVIVQPGEGIAARSMKQRALLRLDTAAQVSDPQRVRRLLGINLRSALAAPLSSDDETITGALALYNNRGEGSRFSKQDAALLKLVSVNLATELRLCESRQQREQASRLGTIGRLLSGVMHDLRTPLAVISGYVQLMQVTDDPRDRQEHAQIIMEQFDIINEMQRGLLAYASGETTLLIRKVILAKFLSELIEPFRGRLDTLGIDLVVEPCRVGVGYFDEGAIARAIHNLVRNSVDAMEEKGGTLTLACHSDADDLVLRVEDTGPGIPKAIRHKLFEPFVTCGKAEGTGLGLANVREIVGEHGGSVAVKSSRRGSRFTISIPGAMRPHHLLSRLSDEASTKGKL